MGKISPAYLVVLGMIVVAVLSIAITVVLLAILDSIDDAIRIMAPFAGVMPPLITGVFGLLKYVQKLEERQQIRHSDNVRVLHEVKDEVTRAADTADRIEYHDKEAENAHLLDHGKEPDAGRPR